MQSKLARLVQRHNSSTTWSNYNPILKLGEIGIETDTNKAKLGDGTTAWNDLPYFVSARPYSEYIQGEGVHLVSNRLSADLQYDDLGDRT